LCVPRQRSKVESPVTIQGAQASGAPRFDDIARTYDALLVLSFGGPEGPADVLPFLENVTRGRGIPPERLLEVAGHYQHFGGVSPINAQNRALIAALETELRARQIDLPVYFGNRNWHPLLTDTLLQMQTDGIREVLVFVTSAFSSYSGCRQYREDVLRAVEQIGITTMRFDKLRVFYNHPGFIEPLAVGLTEALASIPIERRSEVDVVFTAHSIPLSMARGSAYERQLQEASRLVAERGGTPRYHLAWQSRSGPPQVKWLEPDILSVLASLHAAGKNDVVVVPIGFISDHLEVLYDLDFEAQALAKELGMRMIRVPTVGTAPAFVAMIRELIEERLTDQPRRRSLGAFGPNHDICPLNCCLAGAPASAAAREPATA
jgi:ferrochelatase